jgi:hypothetical protein
VQLRAGVLGAGQTPAPKADRGHVEVAPVLLHREVRGGLGDSEQRVRGKVHGHRGIDPVMPAVPGWQIPAGLGLDQRKLVGPIAVDLVGRDEDERGVRSMAAGRLEQIQGSVGVDREVGLRLPRRPIVRWLGRRVDDQLDSRSVTLEQPLDAGRVPDVQILRSKGVVFGVEAGADRRGGRLGAEEVGPHVVLDPHHVVAGLGEGSHGLGANQSSGTRDDRDAHWLTAREPCAGAARGRRSTETCRRVSVARHAAVASPCGRTGYGSPRDRSERPRVAVPLSSRP